MLFFEGEALQREQDRALALAGTSASITLDRRRLVQQGE